jgi:hypothetical protein
MANIPPTSKTQRQASQHPRKELLFQLSAGKRRQMPGNEQSMAQKASQLHRGDYNQRLQQRIVDEGARQGQGLVQPQQKGHAQGGQGLQAIDRHDANEDAPKDGRRGRSRIKPLGQQSGCEFANRSFQPLEHRLAFS